MPLDTPGQAPAVGPILDLRVRAVIGALHASARYPEDGGLRRNPEERVR
jgi:hypothetical protein